jgi:uncharacterized protein (TIGR00255 family)
MKSMTGFGSASGEVQGLVCRLEIKTLNNRFKEFVVRSPHLPFQIEEPVKKLISSHVHRGRVELWIQVEAAHGASGLSLDLESARAVHALLVRLQRELGLGGPITLDHVLGQNVLTAGRSGPEPALAYSDELRDGLVSLARRACAQLMAMRSAEGEVLSRDLLARLDTLDQWLEELRRLAANAPLAATKRYQARLEELAESMIDPARLAQEAAIMAERMDITEEITRFGSHVQGFKALIREGGGPVGRRLEFMLQEMVREANTMGSKCQSKPIADMVLNFKSELEKMREQVLNVE